MRIAKSILYAHSIVMLLTGMMIFAFPAMFVDGLANQGPAVGLVAMSRWYSVPIMLMGGLFFVALLRDDPTQLAPLLRVYLLGDVLQIALAIHAGAVLGFGNGVALGALIASLFAAPARAWLLRTRRMARKSGREAPPFRPIDAHG